ncbi:D-alanyl-D-alanine carboxypeptidase [Virgibacillus dokdonensis]|uniref:D-alanyl-D-alanine carboxypeptidase n=2 Tax=Virgibacillus TaxID=84406 RepID=A0A1M5LKN5_9BACI|nr:MULTISPECIES: D-alanyl-D-alanine carboxypeptidase family protein [Virgibacillus]RFA37207.1 D-alanyl-D-alanine carboxypeptidase [Virgibacillus dokdonensis]SHG65460.1 D-alanyl-D-alanine carboxypeptidase [Virgibacillus chiguensis]
MRFVLVTICSIFLLTILFPVKGHAAPQVSANHAVLMEQSTGRVLFEKQAYSKANIASITKIMTAIIAIESGKMHEKAKVSRKAIYTEGSSIYLEEGEKMRLKDLVYGLMLRSGNDAAVAISEHVGGSEAGFVYLMNEKARWLGMNDTNFANPHGLDEEGHYSTAYDMATLMRYAMKNPTFQKVTGATSYLAETRIYSWQNKNKLLTQYYDHSTGGKTGYTKQTGRTLVSTAEKDDMNLIAVTLNAPDDWRDHITMFEWGFEEYNIETLTKPKRLAYRLPESNEVYTAYIDKAIQYPLTKQEKSKVSNQLFIDETISNNNIIGKNIFYLNGKAIATTNVLNEAPKSVNKKPFSSNIYQLFKYISGVDVLW